MTDNNLTYRTADIAHELPRITKQLEHITSLLERIVHQLEKSSVSSETKTGETELNPEVKEIKQALFTIDNLPIAMLTDYLVEIQYSTDDPHKPTKIWIHDERRGMTIIRIQSKPMIGE